MTKEIELYQELDIKEIGKSVLFPDEYKVDNKLQYVDATVTFLLLEIDSKQPPTDCVLKIIYRKHKNNDGQRDVYLMKYRKGFIFENSKYLLYLNQVDELSNINIPSSISLENKRDESCTAKIFYRVNFPQP